MFILLTLYEFKMSKANDKHPINQYAIHSIYKSKIFICIVTLIYATNPFFFASSFNFKYLAFSFMYIC